MILFILGESLRWKSSAEITQLSQGDVTVMFPNGNAGCAFGYLLIYSGEHWVELVSKHKPSGIGLRMSWSQKCC